MPGGALPYFASVRVCAAEQGMVYNFTIKRLEQCVFLDWKPFKESEDLR